MQFIRGVFVRVPTILAFALLFGIAYWGHHTGWKLPTAAGLRGVLAAPKEDWCEAHGVPDSRCIACHPELGGANPKDWCKEHGVPESKCTVCHPEILSGTKAKDWCKEHGVPESQCTVCHPEIAVKGEVPPASDVKVSSSVAEAPITTTSSDRTTHDPLTCQNHVHRVQFASAESVKKAGVQLDVVRRRAMSQYVTAPGEISYDQTRVARVSTRVGGIVVIAGKAVGDRVLRGDLMAVVDSAEVGRAKAELLQASAQSVLKDKAFERLRAATREGYRAMAELQETEAAAREARIRLLNAQQALQNLGLTVEALDVTAIPDKELSTRMRHLGLPPTLVPSIETVTSSANLIPIASPLDGVVAVRDTVAGEVADTARPLFTVVDTSRMWVLLDIRSEDVRRVRIGQPVRFEPDGAPDHSVSGRVTWVSTAVDDKTRTIRVRAEVDNKDGQLRASTFGTGRIAVRRSPEAVAVPEDALQWEGCSFLVFVRLADDIFQTRKVAIGTRQDGYVEILAGVADGEVVVTTGSHVLLSEVLKGAMGAGCVDD